jgi:hypothetical protein
MQLGVKVVVSLLFPFFLSFFHFFFYKQDIIYINRKMTEHNKKTENDKQQGEKSHIILDDVNVDSHDTPGLLPPQALPTPPPPPPNTQDTSTLLSPWWSEEPPTETIETDSEPAMSNYEKEVTPIPALTQKAEKDPSSNILNISILSFGRSSPKESPDYWKERCILLATTSELSFKKENNGENNVQKELEEIFDKSKECSMVCFLRSSRKLAKDRLLKQHEGDESKLPTTFSINPFYGTWISVAKTPKRCKEHLLDSMYIVADEGFYFLTLIYFNSWKYS